MSDCMIITLDKYQVKELADREGLLTYIYPIGWDVRYLDLVPGSKVVGFEYGAKKMRHFGEVLKSVEINVKTATAEELKKANRETAAGYAKICKIDLNLSEVVSMAGKFPKVPTCCRVEPETYSPCKVFTYWQGIHPLGRSADEATAYKLLRAHAEKLTAEGHTDFVWPIGGYTMGELGESKQSWMNR